MDASALDRVLDCHNAYGAQIAFPATETLDAAREELAALRARVEDLELIARANLTRPARESRILRYSHPEFACAAFWISPPHAMKLQDDGTGLPLLTAEARRALRGENEGKVST